MTDVLLGNDPLASSWEADLKADLRGFARTHLPDAMVPTRFVVLADLPKLPNGKVDRRSLREIEPEQPTTTTHQPPRNAVEARLAAVWQDMLDVASVGVETNFFELGGNSLLVMRMAAGVRDAFDVRVDLRRFLEEPTIARLARQFDCPVVGIRVIRLPGRRFRIAAEGPFDLPRDAQGRIDVRQSTQVITSVIERWVREHPDQWLWFHRRWR